MSAAMSAAVSAVVSAAMSAAMTALHRWRAALACAALLCAAAFTHTQAQAQAVPRTSDGKPDFSGIWQTTSAAEYGLEAHGARRDAPPGPGVLTDGSAIPYLPAALAQRQRNFAAREQADPRLKGWTLGVPRGVYHPEPFQIFQRPRDITILHQFGHSVRTIHTNGTGHPGVGDFWLGDSRGQWQGDTLVVSVKEFLGDTWLDRAGNFHSEALSVVERWRFLDGNTIEYQATLEDPKVYSRPWSISVLLHRHREKNFQLIEHYRSTFEFEDAYPPRKE